MCDIGDLQLVLPALSIQTHVLQGQPKFFCGGQVEGTILNLSYLLSFFVEPLLSPLGLTFIGGSGWGWVRTKGLGRRLDNNNNHVLKL